MSYFTDLQNEATRRELASKCTLAEQQDQEPVEGEFVEPEDLELDFAFGPLNELI